VEGRALRDLGARARDRRRLDEVVVVAGAADLKAILPESVTLLQNDEWTKGPGRRPLRMGLAWCASRVTKSAVIGLGDIAGTERRSLARGG